MRVHGFTRLLTLLRSLPVSLDGVMGLAIGATASAELAMGVVEV